MAAERHLFTVWIAGVVEIVVSLGILAKRGVVPGRCQRQWGAAAPSADELGRQQLTFAIVLRVLVKETVERIKFRKPTNVPFRPSTSGCGIGNGTPAFAG